MDRIKNPFTPGAGSPPPELVGRENVLEQAELLLGRIKAKRAEKSILLTGLRGVGKTVLLNEIERKAAEAGYRTIMVEAHESKSLAALLAPPLRQLQLTDPRVSTRRAGDVDPIHAKLHEPRPLGQGQVRKHLPESFERPPSTRRASPFRGLHRRGRVRCPDRASPSTMSFNGTSRAASSKIRRTTAASVGDGWSSWASGS